MMKIARIAPLLACALLLNACVAWTPRSTRTSPTATTLPSMPLQKWGIESCGAGALSTVLQHYGDPTSMNEWDRTLPKTRGGVMSLDLLIAARQRGFDAQLVTGTPDLVMNELRAGRPVILMLQVVQAPGRDYDFFHYIVVDGYDEDRGLVRTQFGDAKPRWTTLQRLDNAWSGGGHAMLAIRPMTDDVRLASSIRQAVALEDEGRKTEAAALYRTIIKDHPTSILALTNLGNVESSLGNRREAEDAYRRAIAVDTKSTDALNNLAWLLYEERRFDEAETLARQAVGSATRDSYVVLDTLGRILAARGQCTEATQTLRRALDSAPSGASDQRATLEATIADTEKHCRG